MKRSTTLFMTLLVAIMMNATNENINRSKLSPMLLDQIGKISPSQLKRSVSSTDRNPVTLTLSLIKVSDQQGVQSLRDHGCPIIDHVGDIYFALLPSDQLASLSLDDHILKMEANSPASICMDSTVRAVNATPIYTGNSLPQAYTGKGTLVGICDAGFDFMHPMFRDANYQSRIKFAWDIYGLLNNGPYGIGSLYTSSADLLQAKGTIDSSFVEGTDTTNNYHGTHVAGIAAGSAFHCDSTGNTYHGIAYESDILEAIVPLTGCSNSIMDSRLDSALKVAIKNQSTDSVFNSYASAKISISNVFTILGVKYMMDYATEHQQPIVINMSFGSSQDFWTDNRLTEELINRLTGAGRIIVASAGNYSDYKVFSRKESEVSKADTLNLSSQEENPYVTLRSSGDFNLRLYPIGMDTCDTLTIKEADFHNYNYNGVFHVDTLKASIHDSLFTARIFLRNYQYATNDTRYEILFIGDKRLCNAINYALTTQGEAQVDILGNYPSCILGRGNDTEYTLDFPSTAKNVISVGLTCHRIKAKNIYKKTNSSLAYNKNSLGDVVSWSGCGPTLTGDTKPDILAPGFKVYSALNSNCGGLIQPETTNKYTFITGISHYEGKDYYLRFMSGTSQSAPVVSGTIALWLQANPQLTPDDIREVFSTTAKHINPNVTYPNNVYGYGEIDSYAGLLKVLNMTGIQGLSTNEPSGITFRLNGHTLYIDGTEKAQVRIYSTDGRLITQQQFTGGSISLSSLSAGVYAVQVNTNSPSTTGSTLIRL
jgi:subtilisin family serine protease